MDTDPLWTARSLVDNAEMVSRVHRDFLTAGARIVLTCSYQVSVGLFKEELGLSRAQTREHIGMRKHCIELLNFYTILICKNLNRLNSHCLNHFIKENSVRLAWGAIEDTGGVKGHSLVGGSVSPYGACLHDGSEYTGAYLMGEVRALS